MPRIENWRKIKDTDNLIAWINIETATIVEAGLGYLDQGMWGLLVNEDPIEEEYQAQFSSKSKAADEARRYMKAHTDGRINISRRDRLWDYAKQNLGVYDVTADGVASHAVDILRDDYDFTLLRHQMGEEESVEDVLKPRSNRSTIYLQSSFERGELFSYDVPRPDTNMALERVLAKIDIEDSRLLSWAYAENIGGFDEWTLEFEERLGDEVAEHYPATRVHVAVSEILADNAVDAFIDQAQETVSGADLIITKEGR